MSKQIGWSNESNLLYQISQQITRLINVTGTNGDGGGSITGSGTTNYITRWTSSSSLNNSVIYQSSTGNVGIGTTTPSQKLDVNGNLTATLVIAVNDFYGSNVRVNGFYANTIAYMPFYSNVSPFGEIMRVNNNGSLWINRTTDDGTGAKLQINGTTSFGSSLFVNGQDNINLPANAGLKISYNISTNIGSIQAGQIGVSGYTLQIGGNPLIFFNSNSGSAAARFDGNNNFLINRTTDDGSGAKLQISGDLSVTGSGNFTRSTNGTTSLFVSNTANTPLMGFNVNGGLTVATIGCTGGAIEQFNINNIVNNSLSAINLIVNGTTIAKATSTRFLVNRTTDDGSGAILQVNGNINTPNNISSFLNAVTFTLSNNYMGFAGGNIKFIKSDYATRVMTIFESTGNVLIGSGTSEINTAYKLQVDGAARITSLGLNGDIQSGFTLDCHGQAVIRNSTYIFGGVLFLNISTTPINITTTVATGVHTTSGNHLPIVVNGVTYWLALLNPVIP
jgi:hypothetical protein